MNGLEIWVREAVIKDCHWGPKILNKSSGSRTRDGELMVEILMRWDTQNLSSDFIQEVKKKGKS